MLISIVYDSSFGHTQKLANYIATGAEKTEGVEVNLVHVVNDDVDWNRLAASDALIFGSPTYNGTVSSGFKKFMEESTQKSWLPQSWANKVAAGFTNSGAMHGDKLNSLVTMALFAAQHGMIWTGLDLFPGHSDDDKNRIGGWLGLMAQSDDASPDVTPPESDRDTAEYLGDRIATITHQLTY